MSKQQLIAQIIQHLISKQDTGHALYVQANTADKSEMRMYACSCLFNNPFTGAHELTIAASQTLDSFLKRITAQNANALAEITFA